MPVGEMLRRMDSREIAEWQAYFAIKNEVPNSQPEDNAAKFRALFAGKVSKRG